MRRTLGLANRKHAKRMHRWLAITVLVAPLPLKAFDLELAKTDYLPGEPLSARCIWPSEPLEGARRVRVVPVYSEAGQLPRDSAPRVSIAYEENFGDADCVSLRAPPLPGRYELEITVTGDRDSSMGRKPLVVQPLPPAEILDFVRFTEVSGKSAGEDGLYLQFNRTLGDDRCYPDNLARGDDVQQVLVFTRERESGAIGSLDTVMAISDAECLGDCGEPVIEYACRSPGTYRMLLRAPRFPGAWDLLFGQVSGLESCGDACVEFPDGLGEFSGLAIRVLDRVETAPPPRVARIFATRSTDDGDVINLATALPRWFHLWAEFESDNPFARERITVRAPGHIGEFESIELERVTPRLYRSVALSAHDFQEAGQ